MADAREPRSSERDDKLSTRDLLGYMLCRHATWRDIRRSINPGGFEAPIELHDDLRNLRSVLGQKHEVQWVEELKRRGIVVESLSKKDGTVAREARTREAMAAGIPAIHGGVLATDNWLGEPDLLIRRDVFDQVFGSPPDESGVPTELNQRQLYEVADIKLKGTLTVPTLLQVAFYAEVLADLQELTPEEQQATRFHFFLGSIIDEAGAPIGPLSRRFSEHSALVREGMHSVELAWEQGGTGLPTDPEPVEFCSRCDWELTCDRIWREQRDIAIIAGITRREQKHLRLIGINTIDELLEAFNAGSEDLKDAIRNEYRREQLARQARLQIASLGLPRPLHELRPPTSRLFEREDVQRGFSALPAPALGDLYMDFEDYEFHPNEEGRGQVPKVVLFGYVAGTDALESGSGHYIQEVAEHPDDEESAFRRFIAHLEGLLPIPLKQVDDEEADAAPESRTAIFHFSQAEPATFRRLALRYGIGLDLLDRIHWVDLRQITMRVATIGVHRYSLKELERVTGFDRAVPLTEIKLPAIAYMKYLASDDLAEKQRILENFIGYNQDDCRSLIALRHWLESIRATYEQAWPEGSFEPRPFPKHPPKPDPGDPTIYKVTRERLVRLEAEHRAMAKAATDPERHEWHETVAALLGFRAREDASKWLRRLEMYAAAPEKVLEDADAIGGLEVIEGQPDELNAVYAYPEQFVGLKTDKEEGPRNGDEIEAFEGDTVYSGRLLWIDRAERNVCVGWSKIRPMAPTFVYEVDGPLYPSPEIALADFAELAKDGPAGVRQITRALLEVTKPGCLVDDPELSAVERAIQSALEMEPGDVLVVQGPPGTGKSHTAGAMVAKLVERGERVAITTQSHAAYQIVLEEAVHRGLDPKDVRIAEERNPKWKMAKNEKLAAFLNDHHGAASGGTRWTFSSEHVAGLFDTLIVDEAGQYALVDIVAISRCARKVILLGDPQQLPMVLSAEHPEPADRSAMNHWLQGAGGRPTVPPSHGVLLTKTRRMHPLTTEYISQAFYEGRLTTHDQAQQEQRVVIAAPEEPVATLSPLQVLLVGHLDENSYSDAEASIIADVVTRLVRYGQVSTHGGPLRPFRNTATDGDAPNESPDILIVAPYGAQVLAIQSALAGQLTSAEGIDLRPYAQVMTTDKAQGKTAAVVIYSLVRSTVQGARRGSDFLLSPNRLNVAISRARALSVLVCALSLVSEIPQSPDHAKNLNPLKLYLEMADSEVLGGPSEFVVET